MANIIDTSANPLNTINKPIKDKEFSALTVHTTGNVSFSVVFTTGAEFNISDL